jgi:dihydroneopterin aldolase
MKIPSRLLENIGFRIIKAVFGHFPAVETIEVSIFKFNPPIKGICRAAKVTLIRHRP